jgi:hypothetical protein
MPRPYQSLFTLTAYLLLVGLTAYCVIEYQRRRKP